MVLQAFFLQHILKKILEINLVPNQDEKGYWEKKAWLIIRANINNICYYQFESFYPIADERKFK